MFRQWQRKKRFERLIRPHVDGLRRFACKLERDADDAEDLLQEALLQGLTRLDQLNEDRAARVWISRIVYRTFLNRCRKRRSDRTEEWSERAEGAVIPFPGADARLENKRLGQRLEDAMASLPDPQRQAVWLVDGQGFQFSEAAEILGTRPGTVASRVARGRAALRLKLTDIARERGVIP
ncbi:MAG: sigma-70 family RNA polymerase sigma factor [Myxococcota bacterium]